MPNIIPLEVDVLDPLLVAEISELMARRGSKPFMLGEAHLFIILERLEESVKLLRSVSLLKVKRLVLEVSLLILIELMNSFLAISLISWGTNGGGLMKHALKSLSISVSPATHDVREALLVNLHWSGGYLTYRSGRTN